MQVFHNNVGFQNEDDVNREKTIFNEDVIVPVVIAIKQLQIKPPPPKKKKKKKFGASTGFEPMASALADTLGAGQFVEFIFTREIKE